MARVRETTNEYGTPVTEFRCETCDTLFTICPAVPPGDDKGWENCTAPECPSYDPDRDIDKWFDEGQVYSTADGRLIRTIDGGKS